MSKKITTQTDITENEHATAALRKAGFSFRAEGDSRLRITSGPMAHAVIDLSTGKVEGDDQLHSRDTLGALRGLYAESKLHAEILKGGGSILERNEQKNGDIELIYQIG